MIKKPVYKKYWFWMIIIFVVVIVIIAPFIINESYKTRRGYITLLGADDVLSYFGATLSFVGTVALGTLTFWQNEKLRELNNKLFNLEQKSKRGYFVPQNRISAKDFSMPVIVSHFLNASGIVLIGCGDDNIFVKKIICAIDKKRYVENNEEIFVTTDSEFKELHIPVKLNEEEAKKEKICIDVEIYMENSKGYLYKQILYLSFSKEDAQNLAYSVTAFNSKFADM